MLLEVLLKYEGKTDKDDLQQGSLYLYLEIHAFSQFSHENSSFCIINSMYSSKPFDLALPWILEHIK